MRQLLSIMAFAFCTFALGSGATLIAVYLMAQYLPPPGR